MLANLAVLGLGAGGAIQVSPGGTAPVHVLVDLLDWYAPGPAAPGGFQPVAPRRLVDTRSAGGGLRAGEAVEARLTGRAGIPLSRVADWSAGGRLLTGLVAGTASTTHLAPFDETVLQEHWPTKGKDTLMPDTSARREESVMTSRPASKNLALIAMLFAVAMTFIDQTIVAIASPDIQSELGLSRAGSQWVINAYLLALAATFALGGRLADVLGHRRMVLIGIVGFAGASALCGATPTGSAAEAWIIAFRALQGVAGALMIPAALAIVVDSFPVQERGKAMAIFFGVSGGLTAVGPIAGGYLTQWTWRSIFWINVPVAIVALVLTFAARIPDQRRAERIDWRGAALTILGMGLSVLGFEQAQTWGWANPGTWLCIVGGLAVLVLFFFVETRTESPLLRVRVFRDRAFLVDNAVLFFSMIAFVPVFFFASVYSQVSLHYDAGDAGQFLLVFFAGFAPAAQIGGRMLDSGGARRPVILGSALAAAGFGLWAWKVTDLSLGAQWWCIVLAGAGIGFLLGPASTDAVNRAIDASYGEVTGITQTVRNYASALGIAVLGTVLSTVLTDRLSTSFARLGVPADAAAAAADGSNGSGGQLPDSIPVALRTAIEDAVSADFAVATRYVLAGMAVALVLALLVALAHPGGRPRAEASEPAAETAGAAGAAGAAGP